MVRLAVMSDVHGNLPALEAVLEDLQQYELDGVIVAGDFVGGPHPVETTRLLLALDGWMIRGNSDSRLVAHAAGSAPAAEYVCLQFALARWANAHVDRETLDFLRSLPEQRVVNIPGAPAIRVVHGSPRDPSESIFPDRDLSTLDLALSQVGESVLICGHTHIPWSLERNGRLALNPGAVAGPLNGEVGAQYALLTWQEDRWQVEHRTVPYALERIRADFCKSGLLEEGGALARAFLLSIETGENVADDFLAYAYGLTTEGELGENHFVPDDVWEQAAVTFDWDSYEDHG
jgi:putative phosphoesterase